jgi:hypothetical protein
MNEYYKIKGQTLADVADKVRNYTGTTELVKPENLDTEVDNVYEASKQAKDEAFWDEIQQNGNRVNYTYGFGGHTWTNKNFKPKYDIKPTDSLGIFILCQIGDLRKSATGVDIDFSNSTRLSNAFAYSTIKYVGVIDTRKASGSNINGLFMDSYITHIEELIFKSDGSQAVANLFNGCTLLEHLIVSGVIGKNGFNVSWSTKLSHDSLMSIIYALQDKTTDTSGTSWVCTLGTANLAKLTDAEKAVATQKGWSLA